MDETKTIPGFSAYQITNDGRILGYNNSFMGSAYMRPYDASGYKAISLKADNGRRKMMMLHRLVYLAWGGPIPRGYWINHKDGDKHNNHIDNLEAGTPQMNHVHAREVLKRKYARGEQCVHAKLTNEEREAVKTLISAGWSQHRVSRLFNIAQPAVHQIINAKPVNK